MNDRLTDERLAAVRADHGADCWEQGCPSAYLRLVEQTYSCYVVDVIDELLALRAAAATAAPPQ